jgi:hypothetical protein
MYKAILVSLLGLTGCGFAEDFGRICGKHTGDLTVVCQGLFGGRNDTRQDQEISRLKQQVYDLELTTNSLISEIESITGMLSVLNLNLSSLQSQINVINAILPTLADQASIDSLQAQVNYLLSQQSAVSSQVSTLAQDIIDQQLEINNNTIDILELQSNHNVTKVVDPCGDGPGFDEVLLRTSSGKLIASFSQNQSGLNTRFSILTPGSYSTTDGTGCSFTVNGDMSISSSPASVEY